MAYINKPRGRKWIHSIDFVLLLSLCLWMACKCKSKSVMSGMRVFMWYLCLQLRLHRLHCVALTRIFFLSQVFQYLNGTSLHLHIWQLAAGICFEGQSLCLWSELIRCADVCPILFGAFSVNTICAFHFSRLLFHSPSSVWHPPPSTPVCLLLFPPVPPFLFHSLSSCLGPVQI